METIGQILSDQSHPYYETVNKFIGNTLRSDPHIRSIEIDEDTLHIMREGVKGRHWKCLDEYFTEDEEENDEIHTQLVGMLGAPGAIENVFQQAVWKDDICACLEKWKEMTDDASRVFFVAGPAQQYPIALENMSKSERLSEKDKKTLAFVDKWQKPLTDIHKDMQLFGAKDITFTEDDPVVKLLASYNTELLSDDADYNELSKAAIKSFLIDVEKASNRYSKSSLNKYCENYERLQRHSDSIKQDYPAIKAWQPVNSGTNAHSVNPGVAAKSPQEFEDALKEHIDPPCWGLTFMLNNEGYKTTWSNGYGAGAKGVWFEHNDSTYFINVEDGALYEAPGCGWSQNHPEMSQAALIKDGARKLEPSEIGLSQEKIAQCIVEKKDLAMDEQKCCEHLERIQTPPSSPQLK